MRNVLRTAYLVVWVLALTSGCFIILLLRVGWARLRGKSEAGAAHQVASLWGRALFAGMPGWAFELTGREHLAIAAQQPVILVVNHQSNADILPLYFLGLDFCWMAKAVLFRVPMVGQAMRWAGYVAVERGDPRSRERALECCRQRLSVDRRSLLFFPEGTRSRDGKLLAFKNGAFVLSHQLAIPVLPIVMEGVAQLLPKSRLAPGRGLVKMRVLPVWRPEASESVAALRDGVWAAMADALRSEHGNGRSGTERTLEP